MAKQQNQESEKTARTPEGAHLLALNQQVEQISQIYGQLTGADPNAVPHVPIPPEVNPAEYVRQNMEQLQHLLAGLAGGAVGGWTAPQSPHCPCRMDVYESESRWQCAFELPGVTRSDVDLDIGQGAIHLRATRKGFEGSDWRPTNVEMGPCTFERHVPLPPYVRADSVAARYENGVLFVQFERLPSTTETQQKVTVS